MGQFKDMTIKEVVEELNASFFLPDIQREYVWLSNEKDKKIEQLFDSILRGYPIGSFLFWRLKRSDIETNKNAEDSSEKLNFQLYKFVENYDVRNSHNEKINVDQINADDLFIVLDGQQRLTSLYIGLKGTRTLKRPWSHKNSANAYEQKQLYINLRYVPSTENPDDNYQFEFLNPQNISTPDEHTFWFKVGNILSLDSPFTYARQNNLSDSEVLILEKLRNAFCLERLVSYFEEKEKNLDKVLKIFIRVNSGGTQLSYSDLLMSILTANFSSDIRDMMKQQIDDLREKGFAIMGRDQILKTSLLLTGCNHVFILRNFCKKNIRKIESNWHDITQKIDDSVLLLQELGYRDHLGSAYILSTIALYMYAYKRSYKTLSENEKSSILNFVRLAQIKSYFTTSLDNKLKEITEAMTDISSDFELFNKNMEKKGLRFVPDDLDRIFDLQYGNPAVLPILQLLYPSLDYKNRKFHIDHIYPKSKFKTTNKKIPENYLGRANYLYNLQLLEGDENIEKRDKDPEIWLAETYSNDPSQIQEYKRRNHIDPTVCLNWENIETMEHSRTQLLYKKLQEALLGGSISKTVSGKAPSDFPDMQI